MAKLKMLSGLPASGKSTLAKEIVAQGNWIRVNRDLLRKMLHHDAKWTGRKEDVTVKMEREIARKALEENINVVVDDCNLNPKNKLMWAQVAKDADAHFSHDHIDTSVSECVQRDRLRESPVGTHVIVNMSLQYKKYPPQAMPFIICDIDGTTADISHRLHFVNEPKPDLVLIPKHLEEKAKEIVGKKDWDSFFNAVRDDAVRWDVVKMLLTQVKLGYPFIFVSGRPERCRKDTEKWLLENIYNSTEWGDADRHCALIMRQDHDKRDDDILKKEIYDRFLARYPIKLVIDDRPRVIRMWRELKLEVLDVGQGIDF